MKTYFTISELSESTTAKKMGINNTPDKNIERNMEALINNVLNPLREKYGKPIRVNSGYRSPALNKAVGGVVTSQHTKGEAADITGGSKQENEKLFELAQHLKLPFDQLIDEKNFAWVHISYGAQNRRQVLHLK